VRSYSTKINQNWSSSFSYETCNIILNSLCCMDGREFSLEPFLEKQVMMVNEGVPVFKHHYMKTCRSVEVQLHAFLISSINVGK
jgi:hypothetical protein